MEPLGYWTTPKRITDVDLQKIHGHIFSVDTASCTREGEERNALLFPSEFREGPPVSVGNIDGNFFTEFTRCLRTKGLENTLGLEVIQGHAGKMIEFSFNFGNLLLREAEVRGQFEFQETGWTVTIKDGETRCITYPTGHIKASKTQVEGVLDALNILRDEGVLA